MKPIQAVLVLALLLALSSGPLVRPAAQAQSPTMTMTTTVTLMQHVDVFQTASQTYTLTHTPAPLTTPQIFVNGILMCAACGNDYTVAGTTLTFTGQQTAAMDTPAIQVWYWSTNQEEE